MAFPLTQHSIVQRAASPDPEVRREAFGALVQAYWRPVYVYLRARWNQPPADAEDMTQGFFATAFEKGYFDSYETERGRFRTFLRVCLDRWMGNERKAAERIKRGGGFHHLPLDFAEAESTLPGGLGQANEPDRLFQQEWARSVLGLALGDLRAWASREGKDVHLRLFERYDLDDADPRPGYQELAGEFRLPVTQVTNFLALVRRQFRSAVLARIRLLTSSDEEYRQEVRELLGIDPP